jgi:hypothetical protein
MMKVAETGDHRNGTRTRDTMSEEPSGITFLMKIIKIGRRRCDRVSFTLKLGTYLGTSSIFYIEGYYRISRGIRDT